MRAKWMVFILVFVLFAKPGVVSAEESGTEGDSLQTVTLDVQNMACPMCAITIRKALEKVAGVKTATVDQDSSTASVTYDPDTTNPDTLIQATTNAGYPATLKPN